ncbi:hypothetical protein Pla110_32480 [Polystyrenella longa]|uniref:DUF4190 domain-containing protein n=1 Tax=Polystyrenella longa TaxID=2528007 RepID=A0A518CQJ7_9PLAN|nr:hypothetical protein [Polystyrenella longa]QDU81506.1 hypothetical protein Pla110_32480 [Polystyrenella longa]
MSTPDAASLTGDTTFTSKDDQFNDFDYKPIPMMAAVGVALAVFSLSAFLALIGIFVALGGIIVSWIALRTIRKGAGEFGGMGLAKTGFYGSIACFTLGISSHAYAYATEVPDGYLRVHFSHEISQEQFDEDANGRRMIPPVVAKKFVDQKVFLKGYMWNTNMGQNMEKFILLKDNGKCCFGGDPAPYDNMQVVMQDGQTVDYRQGLVSVAGTLRAYPDAPSGQPVYVLEATQFGRAKTSFGAE